jgi:hypothetical protein
MESYLQGMLVQELKPAGNGKDGAKLSRMETSVLALIREHNGNGATPGRSRRG